MFADMGKHSTDKEGIHDSFMHTLLWYARAAPRAGYNPGCGTAGFEVVEGWDPATGLGTPTFPALLKAVNGLK